MKGGETVTRTLFADTLLRGERETSAKRDSVARYDYRFAPVSAGQLKLLESLSWSAIGIFVLFTVALFRLPAFNHLLQSQWPLYLGCLALMYLLFMPPSRRMLRLRKFGSTWLETSRKGVTFHGRLPPGENGEEKTLAWRDITRVKVLLDATPRTGVYVRRIELGYAKGRVIRMDNEPPKYAIHGDAALLRSCTSGSGSSSRPSSGTIRSAPIVALRRFRRRSRARSAPSASNSGRSWGGRRTCGGKIQAICCSSSSSPPWVPRGALMGSVIGSVLLWSLIIPLLLARPVKLRTILQRRAEEPAVAEA